MKLFMWLLFFFAANVGAQDKDRISEYLVDINAAPVNAAALIGVTGSAVKTIQTAQDLAIALNPITSKDTKDAFGLSVNVGRADFVPVSGRFYNQNQLNKLLANLTFGYGENSSEVSGVLYQKRAFAVDTYLFLNPEDDPVIRGYKAFLACGERKAAEKAHREAVLAKAEGKAITDEEIAKLLSAAGVAQATCDANSLKTAKWNASRVSVSYGSGHVKREQTNEKSRLGRFLILTALLNTGDDAGVYLTYQRSKDELDLKTLGSPNLKVSSNSLAAARYVRGTNDATLRYLAEVSNADKKNALAQSGIFKYALGVDKKITDGVWLLFRYGKSVTASGEDTETKGLLNLSISAGCLLNQCKKSE